MARLEGRRRESGHAFSPLIQYIRPSFYICFIFELAIAGTMLVPMLVALADGHGNWQIFLYSSLGVMIVATLGIAAFRGPIPTFSTRFGFLLTTLLWTMTGLVGAIPLLLSPLHLTIAEAYFESISGLTTTGATVLTGLDLLPRSVLLWRSMLQWFGGIGIIAIGLFLFPFLRIGGMQFFRTESSDRSDKAFPRLAQVTRALVFTYVLATLVCIITFKALGMSFFDAVNHAMTTLSTGGFSTHDRSFGFFESRAVLWAAVFFMIVGSLPFFLYIELALRGRMTLFSDPQVRAFVIGVAAYSLALALWHDWTGDLPFFDSLTHSAFNVTSIISTTGYASDDYTIWGHFAAGIFFILTFFGGCSGSTTGGIKIYRMLIVWQAMRQTFTHLLYPHAIVPIRYGTRLVDHDVYESVIVFMVAFFAVIAVSILLLALAGQDFVTAFTGTLTALTNVGPGLGEKIGPSGNFAALGDFETWVLSVVMLLGRLEIMTVLVLLSPTFWAR